MTPLMENTPTEGAHNGYNFSLRPVNGRRAIQNCYGYTDWGPNDYNCHSTYL